MPKKTDQADSEDIPKTSKSKRVRQELELSSQEPIQKKKKVPKSLAELGPIFEDSVPRSSASVQDSLNLPLKAASKKRATRVNIPLVMSENSSAFHLLEEDDIVDPSIIDSFAGTSANRSEEEIGRNSSNFEGIDEEGESAEITRIVPAPISSIVSKPSGNVGYGLAKGQVQTELQSKIFKIKQEIMEDSMVVDAASVPQKSSSMALDALIASITAEDVKSIMPTGLTNGITLWARLAGPIQTPALLSVLRARPAAKTRARSGFLCGVATMVMVAQKKKARAVTDKMKALLSSFEKYLDDFALCVMCKNAARVAVEYKKGSAHINIYPPKSLVTQEFIDWCAAPWPDTDEKVADGIDLSGREYITS